MGKLGFGEFQLDKTNALLMRGDEFIALAPKPFDLLCFLASRPGDLVSKDELINAVWAGLNITDTSLSVAISALRSALGDSAQEPRFIETVPRRGYRFVASVFEPDNISSGESAGQKNTAQSLASALRPRWWVGRTKLLDKVEALLQQSLAGNRQLVFITGEAGIGKTTFVEMAMEDVSRCGAGVLWGRCIELFGTDEAFYPLIEALQEGCCGADGAELIKALRLHAPTWLAQMPGLLEHKDRGALQTEVFGATRERMLREFCELIENLSVDRPWIIVLEDLHWSDFATLDLLSRFARRDRKANVLVFATYRNTDALIGRHPIREIHHDLQIHGRSSEFALDRLSPAEVEDYLKLRFGEAGIVQTLAERIYKRTQGQPLFVVSIVDYFIAEKAIEDIEGHWCFSGDEAVAPEGMPSDLKDMIARQIDRLPPDKQGLLEIASSAGVEFSAALVASVFSRDFVEVESDFEALARTGHIVAYIGIADWPDRTIAGLYAFQHALYQEVLYQRLSPGQRVRTHRRLGDTLEAGYQSKTHEIASMLARHFEAGYDFAKAVSYLGKAAENAAQRFSNREAESYLTHGLQLVERLPAEDRAQHRLKLLHQRAWVRRSAADFGGASDDLNRVIAIAADTGELFLEVRGLMDLSRFNLYGDRAKSLEAADLAFAKCHTLEDEVFKAVVKSNIGILNIVLKGWTNQDAILCREAIKVIGDTQDPYIMMRRAAIENIIQCMTSEYADCARASTQGKQFAQTIGDVWLYVLFMSMEAYAFLHLGEWGKLQESVAAALAITEKNANLTALSLSQLTNAYFHAEAMDYETAIKICEETLTPEVDKNLFNFFWGRNVLAKAYLGAGDLPAALAQFNEIIHRIEVEGALMDTNLYYYFYCNTGEYWLAAGDLLRAREQATRLYEIAKPPQERTYLALAHRLLATIAMAQGDLIEAELQLARALPIVEHSDLPLAAWRVYLTASKLYERLENSGKAIDLRNRAERVIEKLASNFDAQDRRRAIFLAGFASSEMGSARQVAY